MRGLLTSLLLLLPIFAASLADAQDAATPRSRADALLGTMTLDEKVGQLVMTGFDDAFSTDILERGGAGAVISFNDPAAIARAQEKARASRLGIPLLIGLDLLHGFRTLFPMPLAEAASFNPPLAARNAELAARDAKPAGLNWTFAPVADVARDPRWGRMIETNGEDALLARDFTRARADGFRRGGLAPTLKHFAGYGAVSGGRDYDAVSISDFELQNTHLPPFRAALGPMTTVMTALTVLNGRPSSADPKLLGATLRGKWGFDGVVVSDWKAIRGLIDQGVAESEAEAARLALRAGVDIDMMSGIYARHLAAEITAGRVSVQELDAAVRRVLALKFELGLFDAPSADPAEAERAALTPDLRAAGRAAVHDTSVLLRNESNVLPLGSEIASIAVIGPFADNAFDQLGPHEARGVPEDAVTVLRGVTERAAKNGARVSYVRGCDVACVDTNGFAAAVDAAKNSDIVIAVLGEKREHSGEGASRATLDFPGRQDELFAALAATGKPTVLVVIAGRPLDLGRATETASAIVMAWYPGTEGGHGIADLLFGDYAPSAKLPISWPRSVGQAPLSYDRLATARPHDPDARYTQRFLDEKIEPLFPFGFGLTYTRFGYSGESVTPVTNGATVSVMVTNEGERAGTEIVQLYMRDDVASRVQPVKRLVKYARVALQPGETRTVEFVLQRDDFGFFDENGNLIVEPGTFRLGAGPDSTARLDTFFTLAPQ